MYVVWTTVHCSTQAGLSATIHAWREKRKNRFSRDIRATLLDYPNHDQSNLSKQTNLKSIVPFLVLHSNRTRVAC